VLHQRLALKAVQPSFSEVLQARGGGVEQRPFANAHIPLVFVPAVMMQMLIPECGVGKGSGREPGGKAAVRGRLMAC
jgi:hypothetical protein